jgi:exopolyphosphatase / guanosine-5'-triphosphate,3'-diphosphate pyrophosphatase
MLPIPSDPDEPKNVLPFPTGRRAVREGRSHLRQSQSPSAPHATIRATKPLIYAAIDIGSNTTRLLVGEPVDGQLKKVMEQRAYTRIGKAKDLKGKISDEKIEEVGEVVETQVRLAEELGATAIRVVATAAIRDAPNGSKAVKRISERADVPIEIISEHEEGRLAFLGATKPLGHPVEGKIAIVDVGGGSTEITVGTIDGGVEKFRSWPIGSGLADDYVTSDPPSASEIRQMRDRIEETFEEVEIEKPDQVVAVGGSATSLKKLTGVVLEYETLERAIRVISGEDSLAVSRQFELDPERVKILSAGALILEKASDLLGQPLQIGKGGIREGIILDMLNEGVDVSAQVAAG